MMRCVSLLAAAVILASCSGSDEPSIDVSGLTQDTIEQRAFDALNRPHRVLHARLTLGVGGDTIDSHVWVDHELGVGRTDDGGDAASYIYRDGCAANLRSGRVAAGHELSSKSSDAITTEALNYLTLFEAQEGDRKISSSSVDGQAAILLTASGVRTGDFAGPYTLKLYLDRDYLPLRFDISGTLNLRTDYEIEFVLRDDLPPGFFSIFALSEYDLSRFSGGCRIRE